MTENLGEYLRKHAEEYARKIQEQAEEGVKKEMKEQEEAYQYCKTYLDSLRPIIVEDVKNPNKWEASRNGISYRLTAYMEHPVQLYLPSKKIGVGHYVHLVKTKENNWETRRVLYNASLWDEFVTWGKELGLKITINSHGHTETNGADEGWFEHEYYYILVQEL